MFQEFLNNYYTETKFPNYHNYRWRERSKFSSNVCLIVFNLKSEVQDEGVSNVIIDETDESLEMVTIDHQQLSSAESVISRIPFIQKELYCEMRELKRSKMFYN